MKRLIPLFICFAICFSLLSCQPLAEVDSVETGARIHLSDLVGVWSDKARETSYRFTPAGVWYRYNEEGEVSAWGTAHFDGQILSLARDDSGETELLTAESVDKLTDGNVTFRRVEMKSSLAETELFSPYFTTWYEDADLEGKTLTIDESDRWVYAEANGAVLAEGFFTVFSEEEDTPYLFTSDDEFYGTLSLKDGGLSLVKFVRGEKTESFFALSEDSTVTYAYFKEKEIAVNYRLGSGDRLLRNGGAAYNDQRDFKRMSVNCSIDASHLVVSDDTASFDVVVRYTFRKSDLPAMTGRIYNTVRFSQYDFYTGKLFTMEDSTGNEAIECSWDTEHDGRQYQIDCYFSSEWEYPRGEEILVRWIGTYHLTMPVDYDGLILCLRPVFNSYSAQISSSSVVQEDTLALEDLGEDVQKCIFCRVKTADIPAEDMDFLLEIPEV